MRRVIWRMIGACVLLIALGAAALRVPAVQNLIMQHMIAPARGQDRPDEKRRSAIPRRSGAGGSVVSAQVRSLTRPRSSARIGS